MNIILFMTNLITLQVSTGEEHGNKTKIKKNK